jgi:thiosulfate dehydrogenase
MDVRIVSQANRSIYKPKGRYKDFICPFHCYSMSRKTFIISVFSLAILLTIAELVFRDINHNENKTPPVVVVDSVWVAPDTSQIPHTPQGELIKYGRALISNTSEFFGPNGKIAHNANGMNCQNCHLDAGTKPWGNNFGEVFSTYPKFRERRYAIENIFQRVNDCFQRSLNGSGIDSNSREMQAMLAYIKWVGKDVAKGKKPKGSGIRQLVFLSRGADTQRGRTVYEQKCTKCHGLGGEGMVRQGTTAYLYPPLWGKNSFNTGAGLYRLSRFAGYVKDNMPLGSTYKNTQLTDEEAWDVAAYVNNQGRPQKAFQRDWPNIALKPVDHPFGPYSDSFSEQQHKFGPFPPIQKARDNSSKKKS